MTDGLDVHSLVELSDAWTQQWHDSEPVEPKPSGDFVSMFHLLCFYNYLLWHEEDEARREDVPDSATASHKRNIDRHNQLRNETIEKLDEHMLSALEGLGVRPPEDTELNSETPGNIIDRLSISALKIYHMQEQTRRTDVDEQHVEACRYKLKILQEQQQDLAACLAKLLGDLAIGRKRLKLYRQFKMYNDPDLNPALYETRDRGPLNSTKATAEP